MCIWYLFSTPRLFALGNFRSYTHIRPRRCGQSPDQQGLARDLHVTNLETTRTLKRHGADERDLQVVRVPGAYEMPIAAQRLAAGKRFDAIIALGAVIRGGTPHFEYVAGECTKGLSAVSLKYDTPIAFGVLTVDTIEQAIERAGTKAGNKGAEAAMSTIEMINLLRDLES